MTQDQMAFLLQSFIGNPTTWFQQVIVRFFEFDYMFVITPNPKPIVCQILLSAPMTILLELIDSIFRCQ
jgi:hypothetical protein